MRARILTAVLLLIAPCVWAAPKKGAQAQDQCTCTADIQERLRGRLVRARVLSKMSVPTSVVQCDAAHPGGCENEAVVVFDSAQQRCVAALQYCVLCVTPDESFQPVLKWNLVDKSGGTPSTTFVFTKKGVDIPNAVGGGKKHFVNPHKNPKYETTYEWTAGRDKSAKLRHTTNIQPSGKGDGTCQPFDPVIVNNAN